jgi:hypothetical protein
MQLVFKVHYMFRQTWSLSGASKLMLETAALTLMNTIPNYILFHVPMCCCTNSNCVSITRMEYFGVSYSVVGCALIFSAGQFLSRVVCSCSECSLRVTLRLAVYSQSVRLGAKPHEVHDQSFFFFFFFAIEPLTVLM